MDIDMAPCLYEVSFKLKDVKIREWDGIFGCYIYVS